MKRSPIKRRTPVKKSNPKRKREEFARCYHSKERVLFIQGLPCAACGVVGYSENAHLLGNGGTGRKADADTVGPLCGTHRSGFFVRSVPGCHWAYDEKRALFDLCWPDFSPEKVAAETEEMWQANLGWEKEYE